MAIEYTDIEDTEDAQEQEQNPGEFLRSILKVPNVVPYLDKDIVTKIGGEVVRGYDVDKASRADWERQTKTAMDLATQVATEKSWPWPKAANIKYPLITTAAIQFSARAYPSIVAGSDVVKGEVIGPDPDGIKKDRADRIGKHMSYQVLEEIKDWDEEEDKLLLQIAIVGCAFRKTYFDTMMGNPCSDLISAMDLVYDHATPWAKLRRKTHNLNLYKNDVIERVRGGIFTEIELGMPEDSDNDEDSPYGFLECHCWYDLDKDGYKEPYVVTVKKDSSEVVRIIARFDEDGIYLNDKNEITKIIPVEYFTKFSFMPNPDGGSYDIGLGLLLNPINEAVNTVFNQLLDAGTLANTGGGFLGSGLKMKGGAVKFVPGEFKPVDSNGRIGDNIYHMQFPGPNAVLFQLLGMLIAAAKEMSSVQDILTGERQANETATTTLALIEQGQKVFSAIYKRVHRSLKQEFKKIYRLNRLYLKLEDYYRFQDKVETIYLEDYQGDDTDVTPVSDPSLISDGQILARAQALLQFIGDPIVDQQDIRKRYFKAIKIDNVDTLLPDGQPQIPPEVQQQMQQMQEQMQMMQEEGQKLQQENQQLKSGAQVKSMEIESKHELAGVDQQMTREKLESEYALKARQSELDAQFQREKADQDAAIMLEKAQQERELALEKTRLEIQAKEEQNIRELQSKEDIAELNAYIELEKARLQSAAKNEEGEGKEPEEAKETPLPKLLKRKFSMKAPSGGVYEGMMEDM
jgi:chaperonin GroES